ncbi:hypothetical protein SDC9_170833 [bioreactor metagenome]|uniref:Uncharacterized protein n=1 Tax=bioreactor metagenome TaxID=1076179 RepID=A0A645G9X2_9ZZZZ
MVQWIVMCMLAVILVWDLACTRTEFLHLRQVTKRINEAGIHQMACCIYSIKTSNMGKAIGRRLTHTDYLVRQLIQSN